MKVFTYEFTEANGSTHTLRVDKIHRLELSDDVVRTFIPNEIQLYRFDTADQAKKVYKEISKIMEKIEE